MEDEKEVEETTHETTNTEVNSPVEENESVDGGQVSSDDSSLR